MAYQNPRFMWLHAAADAGYANITPNVTINTNYPAYHLIDYRPSSLFKWSNAAANHTIVVDRGAAGLESIDRLIIPAGHNLNGAAFKLESHTANTWAGAQEEHLSDSFTTGIQDFSFTGTNTKRYWRLIISTSGAWEIGQLWLTRTRQATVRGPDPKWDSRPVPNLIVRKLPTREATSLLSANRKAYSLTHHHLDSTDLSILDDLLEAVGVGGLSFYFDSSDSTEDPRLMRITTAEPRRVQDRSVPQSGETYRIDFEMLEQIS